MILGATLLTERALPIDINLILLIVELILLVPTLLLLILGRQEERGRRQLLTHITNTARMVSRQEYFNSVQAAMQRANKSIKGSITGSAPKTRDQEEEVRRIIEEIRRSRQRGVSIQYLFPKSQDRLTMANRYKESGAQIRFHPGLVVSDIRFVVIDNQCTVLGFPSVAGENQPTREGYSIPSEGLAEILTQQFEGKWSQGTEYDDYLKEVLLEIKSHNPNISFKLLSSQLQVEESEIRR